MKKISQLFWVLFLLTSCTGNSEKSTTVKDVALQEGSTIATNAQKALGGQLKKAVMDSGVAHAVKFCKVAAYPILDSLSTPFDVTIKRASIRTRNPQDEATAVERKIIETYQKNLVADQLLEPLVEVLNEQQVLFAQPILMNNPICLNCHGAVGTQVSDTTYATLQRLYPNDNATGHELGELRGIWSITFEKEELENYLKQLNENQEKS